MEDVRIAVVGVGATGTVLAAALITKDPQTIPVDPAPGMEEALEKNGINVSGAISYSVPVKLFHDRIQEIEKYNPNLIFVSTKFSRSN